MKEKVVQEKLSGVKGILAVASAVAAVSCVSARTVAWWHLNEGANGAGWVAHTHTFGPGERPYGNGNDGDDPSKRLDPVPSGHWKIQVRLYTRGSFSSSSYRVINLSGTGAWLINDMIDC